jgi:hypothetical protein
LFADVVLRGPGKHALNCPANVRCGVEQSPVYVEEVDGKSRNHSENRGITLI